MVKDFQYTALVTEALRRAISEDRLSSYLAVVKGDIEKALRLYHWNAEISGALYAPLQGIEITLRNALHHTLSTAYSDSWYADNRLLLDTYAFQDIAKAKATLNRREAPITPPNIVAELSFGFWVSLLSGSYHNKLWTPTLHKSFPNLGKIKHKKVYQSLNHLRKLRNRIAHHEPIFRRHLFADYHSIITATGWISQEAALWLDNHSIFHEVWEKQPPYLGKVHTV